MKILVLGSGLMGPAAAFNVMGDADVTRVTLCDLDAAQLEAAKEKLSALDGGNKVDTVRLDLADEEAASDLMADYDAIVAALPSAAVPMGLRAAIAAGTPWVDLSWPPGDQLDSLRRGAEAAGVLVIPGCGVEPGLTEIMARYLAEKLDSVEEVHIKCGGIPAVPSGPLNYKIVFGGRKMPIHEEASRIAQEGSLTPVPRYSGVETFTVDGVGEVEAWHEGFMPWLLELDALKAIKLGTQKTVRWPGYANKIATLRDLGLLSQEAVAVGDVSVAPKAVVDAVLYPHVKLKEEERDITVFSVEVTGKKKGRHRRYCIDMVDRYDETLDFTSMARVTAFTGAIAARMVARGQIEGAGFVTPEKVIAGKLRKRMVKELDKAGVKFTETVEKVKDL
jgi:lysine 6-dehydrogenase